MALKDWRLEKEEEDIIQWYNPTSKISNFVYLQRYNDGSGRRSEWIWEVANSKQTFIESKGKKTKEQALRLAKTYMKNHR